MAVTLLALAGLGAGPAVQDRQRAQYHNLAWSPDSRWIAYESNVDGQFAIYTVRPDGTALSKSTSGKANDVQPAWSPDGKQMAFTSDRDGHDQLYVMNADGSGQRRLTTSSETNDFYSSYSPDGQWIVFSAQSVANKALYFVSVVRPDGSGQRRLTEASFSGEAPTWSPDGRRVLFSRVPLLTRLPGETPRDFVARRDKATEPFAVAVDGSAPSRVEPGDPRGKALERNPNLSPDTRWFAETKTVKGLPGVYVYETARGAGSEKRVSDEPAASRPPAVSKAAQAAWHSRYQE